MSDVSKDPRPNDKSSIFRCITELQEFLVDYNYPHPLTSKQLMQPSSTDFRNIFEFLVSFLKPNYKMGKNIEVIAPKRLKLYGYPFSIPKSHFQTIGVAHTWPTIVLALTWLRISIQGSMSRDFDTMMFSRGEHDVGREGRQKLLFDYTNESYDMFMKGTDEFDDLRAHYEKKFEDDSQIDKEIEALTRERDQNKLMYEELMSEPDGLANLEQNKGAMELEIEKVERYQLTLETHMKELVAALHICCEEEKEETDRLATLESERERKMHVVGSQLQSGVDFQKLMAKVSALRRQVANREQEIGDRKISLQKLEAEISQDYEKVNAIVIDFNRIARELFPESSELELTADITESEKVRLVFQICEAKTKLTEQAEGLDETLTKERAKVEMLEEFLSENEREKAALNAFLDEKNSQMADLKEKHEKKLKEIEAIMESLKSQQGIKMSDICEDSKLLQKEELAFAEMEARFQQENKEYREFLDEVCAFALQHKKLMQELVSGIDARANSLCGKLLKCEDAC